MDNLSGPGSWRGRRRRAVSRRCPSVPRALRPKTTIHVSCRESHDSRVIHASYLCSRGPRRQSFCGESTDAKSRAVPNIESHPQARRGRGGSRPALPARRCRWCTVIGAFRGLRRFPLSITSGFRSLWDLGYSGVVARLPQGPTRGRDVAVGYSAPVGPLTRAARTHARGRLSEVRHPHLMDPSRPPLPQPLFLDSKYQKMYRLIS